MQAAGDELWIREATQYLDSTAQELQRHIHTVQI